MHARIVLPLLILVSYAAPAAAQHASPYLRVSVGAAQVQAPGAQFHLDRAVQPSLAMGYVVRGVHAVELRAGYVAASVTQTVPPGTIMEAPATIGVRAVPLALAYQLRPFAGARVSPLLSIAATRTRVTDRWRSDTPEEGSSTTLYGFDAAAGLEARLVGGASVVARGYRMTEDTGERYPRGIGLTGAYVDVGLQFGW